MKKIGLAVFMALLLFFAASCEKYQNETAAISALYQTKAQKVLTIMSGGLQTIVMCKNGKVIVAQHTGSSIFGDHFEVEKLQGTTCK